MTALVCVTVVVCTMMICGTLVVKSVSVGIYTQRDEVEGDEWKRSL